MGGVKKKPITQVEKAQELERRKKREKESRSAQSLTSQGITVPILDEKKAAKVFESMKAVTVYATAKSLGVNASIANMLLKNLESKGILQNVGGYSGHYVYRYLGSSLKGSQ